MTSADIVQDFGADMLLRHVAHQEQQYTDDGPQLDLQLKSTTRAEVRDAEVTFDLEVRAYSWLRQQHVSQPRILVLLVLPDDETQWISQSLEALILRRCAYWLSLRGAEPTTNQKTIRVTIPRTNVLSDTAIHQLMDEARKENLP